MKNYNTIFSYEEVKSWQKNEQITFVNNSTNTFD